MLADITSVFDERDQSGRVSYTQSHFDRDQNPLYSRPAEPSGQCSRTFTNCRGFHKTPLCAQLKHRMGTNTKLKPTGDRQWH